ncbi:hypothetical protein MSTO_42770 [Mycobacterium stomatepiae]|uniref:Uncharacterized protein n=1 Tax=Mycobacterium stomatepiae TaxID=470076 RepID=A0A7I7QD88_9MYCO|nr:hypothetical protein MSTO_42770 [Mycobacterium stomatepiae]
MIRPPIAGHHIQWIGSRGNAFSAQKTRCDAAMATAAPASPMTAAKASMAQWISVIRTSTGNTGAAPRMNMRSMVAIATALATGTRLRGRNSKSSNSTANTMDASGALKVAAMPPAAPEASRIFRSSAVRCRNWDTTEPIAPPVMTIGPSAPNGPPVPMLMAAEMGFSTATLGSTRLLPIRITSIVSGMP